MVALALLGTSMIRTSAVLALCGVVMSVAPAGRGENSPPPSVQPTFYHDLTRADAGISVAPASRAENGQPPAVQPTFYEDLARADAMVDATAAQSLISGYRRNNRLEPLAVDPELMRIASEQARAMAARNQWITTWGVRSRSACARRASTGVSRSRTSVPATTHSPMRFPAGAIRRCIAPICSIVTCPHGNRRGLCADLQIQGILGAYPRRPRGASRLSMVLPQIELWADCS